MSSVPRAHGDPSLNIFDLPLEAGCKFEKGCRVMLDELQRINLDPALKEYVCDIAALAMLQVKDAVLGDLDLANLLQGVVAADLETELWSRKEEFWELENSVTILANQILQYIDLEIGLEAFYYALDSFVNEWTCVSMNESMVNNLKLTFPNWIEE